MSKSRILEHFPRKARTSRGKDQHMYGFLTDYPPASHGQVQELMQVILEVKDSLKDIRYEKSVDSVLERDPDEGSERLLEQAAMIACSSHVTLSQRFKALTADWKANTAHFATALQAAMHPAYQQIIGMGPFAIPLILESLEEEPDHWFWALSAITGENPVAESHKGKLQAMTQDWLAWAEQKGYER
jgi:hypothetical protein